MVCVANISNPNEHRTLELKTIYLIKTKLYTTCVHMYLFFPYSDSKAVRLRSQIYDWYFLGGNQFHEFEHQ